MSFNISLDPPESNSTLPIGIEGKAEGSTSVDRALSDGINRTDKPFSNVKRMLEDENLFNSEISASITHQEALQVDLSRDFHDLKEHAKKGYTHVAIGNFLENRIRFAKQVFEDIHKDLDQLCPHFGIDKDNILSITLRSLGADSHNKGKSTVFIDFTTKTGQTTTIVYKPRQVVLEKIVCDKSSGILTSLKKITALDEVVNIDKMTYPVLAMKSGTREYGYSLKVEGLVLYDENPTSQHDPSLTTDNFMKKETPVATDTFHATVKEIKDAISALVGGTASESLKKSIEDKYRVPLEIDKLQELLKKTLDQSYFSTRDNEPLLGDCLLFHVLSKLELGDLHGGNFILSNLEALVPIDLECFQRGDADAILRQIQAEMDRRGLKFPEHLLDKVKEQIDKMNLNFKEMLTRDVPVATKKLYQFRISFLIQHNSLILKTLIDELTQRIVPDDNSRFENLIEECFDNFDIPFFESLGSRYFMDSVEVGRFLTSEEFLNRQLDIVLPQGNSSANSQNSLIINDE